MPAEWTEMGGVNEVRAPETTEVVKGTGYAAGVGAREIGGV